MTAKLFATLPDAYAQGVSYSPVSNAIYVATNQHVYEIPYETGDVSARSIRSILNVRTGAVSSLAPVGDTDVHHTTSVLASGNFLYVSVGSSCNACAETDPTRAVVLRTNLAGGAAMTIATRVRNAIALGTDPLDGHVWIGGAGQDCLAQATPSCSAMDNTYETFAHPYEWVDDLSAASVYAGNVRAGVADYAWPVCEENARAAASFASPVPNATPIPANVCQNAAVRQAEPIIEFPAYTTHIGLAIYQPSQTGTYKLPAPYNNALIVTSHGSWHENAAGLPVAEPDVAYVPFANGKPAIAANFSDPTAQYRSVLFNYQDAQGNRIGQPTGVAVGAEGSLFIADDYAGIVYRVRPGSDPNSFAHRTAPSRKSRVR